MAVNPIPDGYYTVVPVLTVHVAVKLIDFLKQEFDSKETYRSLDETTAAPPSPPPVVYRSR